MKKAMLATIFAAVKNWQNHKHDLWDSIAGIPTVKTVAYNDLQEAKSSMFVACGGEKQKGAWACAEGHSCK